MVTDCETICWLAISTATTGHQRSHCTLQTIRSTTHAFFLVLHPLVFIAQFDTASWSSVVIDSLFDSFQLLWHQEKERHLREPNSKVIRFSWRKSCRIHGLQDHRNPSLRHTADAGSSFARVHHLNSNAKWCRRRRPTVLGAYMVLLYTVHVHWRKLRRICTKLWSDIKADNIAKRAQKDFIGRYPTLNRHRATASWARREAYLKVLEDLLYKQNLKCAQLDQKNKQEYNEARCTMMNLTSLESGYSGDSGGDGSVMGSSVAINNVFPNPLPDATDVLQPSASPAHMFKNHPCRNGEQQSCWTIWNLISSCANRKR